MTYDLEMERVINTIKKKNSKKILIQLPDGLKPKAKEIADEVKEKTGVLPYIWIGSCYGACDVPFDVERLGIDLLIQWGHKEWAYGYQ